MPANLLLENGSMVMALQMALTNGTCGLAEVPGLVKHVITEGRWRERVVRQTREPATFSTFEAFVQATPPEGLGADVRTLQRLCADDAEALDLLDEATTGRQGAHKPSLTHGMNHSMSTKQRARSGQHIRRLRKDFDGLHGEVLNGHKSVTAAAVEAGIYPRRIPINLGSPESAAETIRKHAAPEFVERLCQLLRATE